MPDMWPSPGGDVLGNTLHVPDVDGYACLAPFQKCVDNPDKDKCSPGPAKQLDQVGRQIAPASKLQKCRHAIVGLPESWLPGKGAVGWPS